MHRMLWILALCASRIATAQVAVPGELHGWEPWVMYGHESHRCPWLVPGQPQDERRICAWPGVLELAVDAHGGRFSQRWEVSAEGWLPLPGSHEYWPENVTLDGKAAAVVSRGSAPVLRVAAGAHLVSGTFTWARRPELLWVSDSVALISLLVDGAHVAAPQRENSGIVLGAQATARQDNRLDVHVFRLLDDALPALLTTQLHLSVAGEPREVRMPQALPASFVPISIDATLAARLDPDGTLRVQVRPGEYDLTVEARGPSPVTQVHLGARPAPWPVLEVWSFRAEDRLRVVSVEGVESTDPAQANVPGDWQDLPAFHMTPEATLNLVERGRGLSPQEGNQLVLKRTAWLDFSGDGYTVVDSIGGQMRQGWRLEMGPPYALQSARKSSGEALLVTSGMEHGLTGPEVAVAAVSRLPRTGAAMPATGWHERMKSVSGTLVVAPGYRLLAAVGPDSAPGAWLERWRLLDIFAVLLIGTVAWRVFGVRVALVAVAAIALMYQEASAPTWLWLNVLLALALLRAAPEGRLRRWAQVYRALALVVLLFAFVPFALTQLRLAVYPQLDVAPATPLAADYGLGAMTARVELDMPASPEARVEGGVELAKSVNVPTLGAPRDRIQGSPVSVQEVVVTGARRSQEAGNEPGVIVQAGPGLPQWRYRQYGYSWSGPVEADATARFVISPPWLTRLWRLAGILLSVLLLLELTRTQLSSLPPWVRSRLPARLAVLLAGCLLGISAAPRVEAASTPDPALLSELQTRLLAAPKCAPQCAEITAADVNVAARLSVVMTVSALDSVGVAQPSADPQWTPDAVQVDGNAAGLVYRDSRGVRYLSVSPGRHVVRIEGSLQGVDGLSLTFALSPRVISVSAAGWDTSGILQRHLQNGVLGLVRHREPVDATGGTARQEEFPAFVGIQRMFHLGHDWTIDTTVQRIAPKSSGFNVTVPLLERESVTSAELEARNRAVTVALAAGEDSTRFSSMIPVSDAIELAAAAGAPYTELWSFDVGSAWHVQFKGTPAVLPLESGEGVMAEYYPRPGEHLSVSVTRPPGIAGGTLAFDSVRLLTTVGKRSSDTTLELSYRSTQGGRQTLHLPADARVNEVLSDATPVGLRPERGELSLSAMPGTHTWSITWQTPVGASLLARTPEVALAAPAGNLHLTLVLPPDRWVLYAFGRGQGPTILYWGELLAFMILAWLIGRSRLTPLSTGEWLLLGLGLSTFSWLVFGLFVAFVAVFQWRANAAAMAEPRRFNTLQVLLGVLAVIAIAAVVAAVPGGLLAHPDMSIRSSGSGDTLSWFLDRTSDALPRAGVLSVSLWWYKIAMLAWALWLSFALTRWVRWAWQIYARDGLWHAVRRTPAVPEVTPTDTGAAG
jgi:hypothetical protein